MTVGDGRALAVDGVEMKGVVAPEKVDEIVSLLAEARRAGESVLLRGGGSRLGLGNRPARPCRVLDLGGLSGAEQLEKDDGVVKVRCGTPVAELRAICDAEGWELPLPAPDARSTVGGAIATAALGARSLGFGPVRDTVLGLEVVLASGERTKCGGRVVKNVTGYDLAKLYTGSLGRLGVVTSAWLRLRARPEAVRLLAAELEPDPKGLDAFECALEVARRETARATAVHLLRGERPWLVAEFAGDPASVAADVRYFAKACATSESEARERALTRALDLETLGLGLAAERPAIARLSGSASQLAAATEAALRAGFEIVVHPGTGVATLGSDDCAALIETVRKTRALHGVGAFIERLPAEEKREHDVFQLSAAELGVTRSLVERFDPAGLLNPGRFAGRA